MVQSHKSKGFHKIFLLSNDFTKYFTAAVCTDYLPNEQTTGQFVISSNLPQCATMLSSISRFFFTHIIRIIFRTTLYINISSDWSERINLLLFTIWKTAEIADIISRNLLLNVPMRNFREIDHFSVVRNYY